MALGRARITSEVTQESTELTFGVVHLGEHNIMGGVGQFQGQESFREVSQGIVESFERADFPEFLQAMGKNFGSSSYTLKLLFRDEQRKILNLILGSALAEAEALYRQVYANHVSLMRFVTSLGMPLPKGLRMAAEFTLNAEFRRALDIESPGVRQQRINSLLEEITKVGASLDEVLLGFRLRQEIKRLAGDFCTNPRDPSALKALENAIDLAHSLRFQVDLWVAQNAFYRILETRYPELYVQAGQGDEKAQEWINRFRSFGERLFFSPTTDELFPSSHGDETHPNAVLDFAHAISYPSGEWPGYDFSTDEERKETPSATQL